MKTWKEKEKQLTAWLQDAGIWPAERMSRALRGEMVEDIAWGPVSVELKTRKESPPQYMLNWLKQATMNSQRKIPLVVVHRDRMKMGQQMCVLTVDDLIILLRTTIKLGEDEYGFNFPVKGEGDVSTNSSGTEGDGTLGGTR